MLDRHLDTCFAAAERASEAVARMEKEALHERDWVWAQRGLTNIWGIPL